MLVGRFRCRMGHCSENCRDFFLFRELFGLFRLLHFCDFLGRVKHFQTFHGVRLVLFLRVSVPHNHIEFAVTQ